MKKTEKGYTNVRNYDTYASYNADTERNDATISFMEQDNSVWVRGKQYSMNAECYVGSDVSGISTTGNWFLCGETTFSQYMDVNIIGSAVNTYDGGMGGLFVLNLRSSQQQINPNCTFQWLCKVGSDAKTPVLRYVINGMTIKLYCKVFGGQYNRIHIRIFNQVNRAANAVHKESFFTLKDSTTIIPEADVPSGTDIADVPYLLKNDTATSATKLATSRKIGFANFNGTTDVSLNTMQGEFQLRWTTNTTQWMRVIRFKTNAAYIKNSLVIAIQDIESFYFSGLLSVYIGTTSNVRNVSARINWIALNHKNGDFSRAFRAYATYPTDTDEYVYVDIYVNSQLQYINMQFNVLTVYDTANLTIGNSGTWLEESAITGSLIYTSKAESSLVPNQSLSATDSAFMQSLEGLCHKSNDSSLDLRRRTEYICGQQVLSDTEEAGKAFYGSSANPLVISVPFKDPGDVVAGGKVNVNIIRFYYAETYWQEFFFGVNSPSIYTRWVASGNARPWYRMMKEDSTIEYNAWVTKATTAGTADVANKTKYPLIVASGNTQFNWYADSTLKLSIPQEMMESVGNGVFTMKVPTIEVAKKIEVKNLASASELILPAIQNITGGMSLGVSPITYQVGTNTLGVNISGKSESATTAGTADVANKTKYPLIVASGNTQFNWYADSTLKLSIPQEMMESVSNGVFTMKVPTIEVAKKIEVKNLASASKLTLPAIQNITGGMSLGVSPITYQVGTNTLGVNISGKSESATTAGTADVANKTKYPFILKQDGVNVNSWYAQSTAILDIPSKLVKSATSGGITLRRANQTFCATAAGGSNSVGGTPYRIIKLTSYDMFDDVPQDGDILHLWVQKALTAGSAGYPLYIPTSAANESSYTNCIILYHGQTAGTPHEWTETTSMSSGFYMFVYRADVKGTNTRKSGGWVFLYRNVSAS